MKKNKRITETGFKQSFCVENRQNLTIDQDVMNHSIKVFNEITCCSGKASVETFSVAEDECDYKK